MRNLKDDEQVVYYGAEVKALGDGKLGGYLVLFGDESNPDLHGDYFTKDTDFGVHLTTPTLYAHGLDPAIKKRAFDPEAAIKTDDVGVWIEAQLDLRDEYENAIYGMVEAGKMGWSSGTASHLVEREKKGNAYHITRWPLGLDASLTPTPAEPRTQALPLKSLQIDPLEISHQDEGDSSAENEQTVNVNIRVTTDTESSEESTNDEVKTMADEQTPVVEPVEDNGQQIDTSAFATKDELKNVSDGIDTMSSTLNALVEKLTNSGPMKDVGYIAPDDEAGKPEVKSFADFIIAVARGNHKRLTKVYNSTKDLSGETGTAGGYLVPEAYEESLLQFGESTSQIIGLVQRVPVDGNSGRYPTLDQYITPTAGSGQTAMAAGVVATPTSAGGTLTETEPGFEMLQWRLSKVGGFTEVENELIADSPMAIETLLTSLFGVAIRARKEQLILRGTGAGEPLGILNSNAAIGITPATNNTFAYADALGMYARFKSVNNRTRWVIHPGIWPDIGVFETSAGGGVFQANLQAALGNNILGEAITQSEHLPQDDNSGCVLLADFSAYLLFERSGISIAFSEHAAFTSEKGTFRFSQRFDGMPWTKSAITLADPQGSYSQSPFVYLND